MISSAGLIERDTSRRKKKDKKQEKERLMTSNPGTAGPIFFNTQEKTQQKNIDNAPAVNLRASEFLFCIRNFIRKKHFVNPGVSIFL